MINRTLPSDLPNFRRTEHGHSRARPSQLPQLVIIEHAIHESAMIVTEDCAIVGPPWEIAQIWGRGN